MMTSLFATLSEKAMGAFTRALGWLSGIVGIMGMSWKAGHDAEKVKSEKDALAESRDTTAALHRMIDAANDAPKSTDDVKQRLEKGTF